jgi:hypothetical protein
MGFIENGSVFLDVFLKLLNQKAALVARLEARALATGLQKS